MSSPVDMSDDEFKTSISKGRLYFVVAAVIQLGTIASFIARSHESSLRPATLSNAAQGGVLLDYVYLGLLAGLFFSAWKGFDWARWILVGIAVERLFRIIPFLAVSAKIGGMFCLLQLCPLILLSLPSTSQFLAARRNGR